MSLQNYYKLLTKLILSNKTKLDGDMGSTVNYIVLSFTPHVISSYLISNIVQIDINLLSC